MKVQSSKKYNSTKFVVLHDSGNAAKRIKKILLWTGITLILCLLSGSSVAYFYYKFFIDSQESTEFTISNINNSIIVLKTKQWIATEKQTINKELSCEESQLQAIPLDFINRNTHGIYLLMDLLYYYEDMINKHDTETLKSIFNEYHQRITYIKRPEDFLSFLKTLKSNKFKFYSRYLKAEDLNLSANDLKQLFDVTDELRRWYDYLNRLGSFLSHYEQQKNRGKYSLNVTNSNFNKFTTETQQRLFRVAYQFNVTEKKLQEINQVLREWATPIKIENNNSSVMFFSKILLLSEVDVTLKSLNIAEVRNVFIFADRIIYADEDFTFHGGNVAIISPSWVFLKKIKIDLSGEQGEEHKHKTARDGESGKPGNPGGNGGDFLGVGDINEKFLRVYSKGGSGGDGQNGAKGRQGVNYSHPDPPVNVPTCVVKIFSFKNSFGQNVTHYKIFGEAGCGSSGTDGGVGGRGGKGGRITLITESELKITRSPDGEFGSPGKGGKGGIGGRDGCFYEALDIDDEVLHCVTAIKCLRGERLPAGQPGKDNSNREGELYPPLKDNLYVSNSFYHFIRMAGDNLIQHNDPIISFLKIYQNKLNETDPEFVLKLYKLIDTFDNIELFKVLNEYLSKELIDHPGFKYLRSLVLGKISILQKNINYFFVDFNNYLNIIKKSVRNINENTREFPAVTYLKQKVGVKMNQIKENLKDMKTKLLTFEYKPILELVDDFSAKNAYRNLSVALQERRIFCIILMSLQIMASLINLNKFEISHDLCSVPFDIILNNGLMDVNEKYNEVLIRASTFTPNIHNEVNVFNTLKGILSKPRKMQGGKKDLNQVKDCLDSLTQSLIHSEEGKVFLEGLIDDVQHLQALYEFMQWEEVEKSFMKSLDEGWDGSLSSELIEIMIQLQYKLAVDAAQQRLYPFIKLDHRMQLQNKMITDEAQEQINQLRDVQKQNSFCQNNLEAVFDRSSAMGEFYFWPNAEIRNKLKDLFRGVEINLKADLINRHVIDKSFVKFNTIKFEFESHDKILQDVLNDFKIEVTHSGYSYYNRRGETHVVVSEEIRFDYSLKTRKNGEPELYSSLFKKCQNGEILLSPYTTWTIQLFPINNEADFEKLSPFVDIVDLRLIGIGSFMS